MILRNAFVAIGLLVVPCLAGVSAHAEERSAQVGGTGQRGATLGAAELKMLLTGAVINGAGLNGAYIAHHYADGSLY